MDHFTHTIYNGNSSGSTAGPMTANPAGAIYFTFGGEGDLFDSPNATGPGSLIELAAEELVTLNKGQTYTMAFDASSTSFKPNSSGAGAGWDYSVATQFQWVLLDSTGKLAAELSPWYSTGGTNERYGTEYGTESSAVRLVSKYDTDGWTGASFTNYTNDFTSTLDSGQYRVALAYHGGNGGQVMLDRIYFGGAQNPINAVSGTGTPGSTIELFNNGGTTAIGTTTVNADGTWTVSGLNLPAGTNNFTAKSTDAAGVSSDLSNGYAYTVAPVVLDLNGDGQIGYSQIQMDMNRDGVLDTTAWAGAQDGVLFRDQFGDGSIRSNAQFAFARSADETDLQGLAALYDSNQDGLLNKLDAQFAQFSVWQDANQNGVVDAGEARTLAELDITQIGLVSDGVQANPAQGVSEAGRSSAERSDGSQVLVADAAFTYEAQDASAVAQVAGGVLSFTGANTTIDLGGFMAHNATGALTQVDLTGTGDNALRLSLSDVLAQSQTNGAALQVHGDAGDVVALFTQGQTPVQSSVYQDGHSFNAYDLDRNGSIDLLIDQSVRVSLS